MKTECIKVLYMLQHVVVVLSVAFLYHNLILFYLGYLFVADNKMNIFMLYLQQ